MKELVVISGKGGTGKTSVVAAFAHLGQNAVLADCDVDAADLHLVLSLKELERHDFSGGNQARIVSDKCTLCGKCMEVCRFEAVKSVQIGALSEMKVDPVACEGCGVCAHFCPSDAIEYGPVKNGEYFVSKSDVGTLVHAKLGIAEENSGKLVSVVRKRARDAALKQNAALVIVDGPPGIGCPVIASITGADAVLIVTEPTVSGEHDLDRVAHLCAHFKIPAMVCVNKWDINPQVTERITDAARANGIRSVGNIGFDRTMVKSQIEGKSVIAYSESLAAVDIRAVWDRVKKALGDIV